MIIFRGARKKGEVVGLRFIDQRKVLLAKVRYYPTKLVIDKMDCLNVSCSKESQRPFQRPLYAIVYAKSILRQFLHHKTFSAILKNQN